MKALLIKDTCTMLKQMKIFLVLIILMAAVPGFSSTGFAIVYASMLPITALAYDERAKWDKLAAAMPFSERDIVASKYVFGFLLLIAATLVCAAAKVVSALITHDAVGVELVYELMLVVAVAIVLMSINLPLMFKIGVEKGRMFFIVISVGLVIVGVSFSESITASTETFGSRVGGFAAALFIASIAVSMISMIISTGIYKRKEH